MDFNEAGGLADGEVVFLRRRGARVRTWRWVGVLLLFALCAAAAWIYLHNPLMIDPSAVAERLEQDDLESGTLALLALFAPMMVILAFVLTALIILFGFICLNREGRYLGMIASLLAARDGREAGR